MSNQKKGKNIKDIGSSETTREASVFHFNLATLNGVLFSKNKEKTVFLEWFIGFTEGNGSFALSKFPRPDNPTNTRPTFQINQKHPQVLYKLKKELGFGIIRVQRDKENTISYYRYSVYELPKIRFLILIFNGNLVLDKVRIRFAQWVESYNNLCNQNTNYISQLSKSNAQEASKPFAKPQDYIYFLQKNIGPQIVFDSAKPEIDLNSAWLAGFSDAEAGFYASLSKNKRFLTGYRERYKFYLTQKGERPLLQKIDQLIRNATLQKFPPSPGKKLKSWDEAIRIYELKKKKDVYKLDISRLASLEVLVDYFDKYPLLSKQQLVFIRWKRLFIRREALRDAALSSPKGMRRYERLFKSIGKIRERTGAS